MRIISTLISIFALLLGAMGMAFLVFPARAGAMVVQTTPAAFTFIQMLGAACIGLGAANWVARRSTLGGIYGRAVVVGNQAFFLIGALVLLGNLQSDAQPGYWLLLAVLLSGAVLYSWLLLRGPITSEHGQA